MSATATSEGAEWVPWQCPRCGKRARANLTALGPLGLVRCTCGSTSRPVEPEIPAPGEDGIPDHLWSPHCGRDARHRSTHVALRPGGPMNPDRPLNPAPCCARCGRTLDRQGQCPNGHVIPPGPCPDTGMPVESCLCMTHDPDGAHFRTTRNLPPEVPLPGEDGIPDHLWSPHCDEGCCL